MLHMGAVEPDQALELATCYEVLGVVFITKSDERRTSQVHPGSSGIHVPHLNEPTVNQLGFRLYTQQQSRV